MITALGDSHTAALRDAVDRVVMLSGCTLHRMGRPGWMAATLRDRAIVGTVVLVAGEVDVRCHFDRTLRDGVPLDDVVARHVFWAMTAAGAVVAAGHRPVLCAVIPPIEHAPDPAFPVAGSLGERATWTAALNDGLRVVAHALRLDLIDPYHGVTRPDGTLDPAASDGTVHLSADAGRRAFASLRDVIGP